jgi:DNA-binding MarR family transcriptional regulator
MKKGYQPVVSEIINDLIKLSRKMNRLEKRPLDFGTGELLNQAEIHMIEAIGDHQHCTVTDLCKHFAITKGAVSQVVGRLSDKGYLSKDINANYVKEKFLTLTEKGTIAFQGHLNLHTKMDSDLIEHFEYTSIEEINRFRKVLRTISDHVDKYLSRG